MQSTRAKIAIIAVTVLVVTLLFSAAVGLYVGLRQAESTSTDSKGQTEAVPTADPTQENHHTDDPTNSTDQGAAAPTDQADAGSRSSGSPQRPPRPSASLGQADDPGTGDSDTASTPTADDYRSVCANVVGGDSRFSGAAPFDHPRWGRVSLVTCGPTRAHNPTERQGILVVDSSGDVRWKRTYREGGASYKLEPASPVTDATGNVFVVYNPGRYDGVAILRPTTSRMTLIAGIYDDVINSTTPNSFYFAELRGPRTDGEYTIRQYDNDCNPSCASGTTTHRDYRWNGERYVPKG